MKKKVILGLSGGVDSGIAVKKLKKMGFDTVFALNHLVFHGVKASSREVLDRAAEICRREEIFFDIIDLSGEFSDIVVKDFCSSYLKGQTPNPCVICNERIKFTLFYDKARVLLAEKGLAGMDEKVLFSTGHYVRLKERDGRLFLKKALDPLKDQSYMLYRLSPEILSRCVFPMGDYYKKDIIKEAENSSLSFDNIRESQDICFIEGDYSEFISAFSPDGKHLKEGKIIDTGGRHLGMHRGYINYTTGQRKGLGLGNGPWYVIEVDSLDNTVTVGRVNEQGADRFDAENLNWFIDTAAMEQSGEKLKCSVKVRYNSREIPCDIDFLKAGPGKVCVELSDKTVVTPGQSAVFYDRDVILGGGIICKG